jgi:hypothetical protein
MIALGRSFRKVEKDEPLFDFEIFVAGPEDRLF